MRNDKQLSELVRITHAKKSQAEIRDHNKIFDNEIKDLIIALKEKTQLCEIMFGLIASTNSERSIAIHRRLEDELDVAFKHLKDRIQEILNYRECQHPLIIKFVLILELKLSNELGDEKDDDILDEIYSAVVDLLNAIAEHYDVLKMIPDQPVAVDNKMTVAAAVDNKAAAAAADDKRNADDVHQPKSKFKKRSMQIFRFTSVDLKKSGNDEVASTLSRSGSVAPIAAAPAAAASASATPAAAPYIPEFCKADDDEVASTLSQSAANAETPVAATPDAMTPAAVTAPATPAAAAPPVSVAAMQHCAFLPAPRLPTPRPDAAIAAAALTPVAGARVSLTAPTEFEVMLATPSCNASS